MIAKALLAAALYQTCGPAPQQPDVRCTLRISAKGVAVDGEPMTPEKAVARCKQMSGAMVIVADDAPPAAWPDMRARLERAKIKIYLRGPLGDFGDCADPLAKGCL
jgi:hypothetical protein